MSETERLRYIHSGKCMEDLEMNGFHTILEQLTCVTQERVATLSAVPEIKEFLKQRDGEKLFTKANTAITSSYGLLYTIADSLADSDTYREFEIADANQVISEKVLEGLKGRVHDITFQLLDTTRILHFQAFLDIIKERGSVRVSEYVQLQYIDGKYILRAIKRKRIKHLQNDFMRNLLAREPHKHARSIRFQVSMPK